MGGTTTQTVIVTVTDANDDPVFVPEHGQFRWRGARARLDTATDADGDMLAYGLSGGADQALFNLDSSLVR